MAPSKKMQKVLPENQFDLEATLKPILERIETGFAQINENLEKMNNKPIVTNISPTVVDVIPGAVIQKPAQATSSGLPIPTEYTEILHDVLNKKFAIDINYMADTASFEIAVLVPQEYSNAGKPHWDTYHEDRRSKVIENALGVTGVRDWFNMIYENFGQEMKSKISFDRSQI